MADFYVHECRECRQDHANLQDGLCPDCRDLDGEVEATEVLITSNPDVLGNSAMTGQRTILDEIISAKLPTQIEPQEQGE